MVPIRLNPLQQPTSDSCQSTAIAILAGATPEDLPLWVDAIHGPFFEQFIETGVILKLLGMPFIIPPADNRIIKDNCVYLATVPSLNMVGGFHSIVTTIVNGCWHHYIDPGQGREGRKYYLHPGVVSDDPLAVRGVSGIVEAYCTFEELWKWQRNNPPLTHSRLLAKFTQELKAMVPMT